MHKYFHLTIASALLSGCAAAPVRQASSGDSFVEAADENFFAVISSNRATTRLDAINGQPTGAWRYNRGSGYIKPGPVALLLRFWGENKLNGPSETYSCVRFIAEPNEKYTVSAITTNSKYVISIDQTSTSAPRNIGKFDAEFSEDARKNGCV